MKRFILSVLCVTVFCIGLGALVDKAGAKFKSDERALALIKQARLAIGGDQSIADVRSMIIKGNTNVTLKINDTTRTEQGETEIAMQLPDKLSKMVKIGHGEPGEGVRAVNEKHDVIIMRSAGEGHGESVGAGAGGGAGTKKVIVTMDGEPGGADKVMTVTAKDGGEWTTADGKTVKVRRADGSSPEVVEDVVVRRGGKDDARFERHRENEMLRLTLSLLLTAPEGLDVNYTYGGDGDVDGTPCNIVNAEVAGSNVKLYLSKASSLPVMVSYTGHAPQIVMFKRKAPEDGETGDKNVMFNHKVDTPEMAEIQVRFGDYRGTNGVQLPYKWTTMTGGQTSEVFDVTSYEINPANIADKFKNEKVMWKTTKDVN